ncbi:hypothetical protein Cgig2_033771 [Carnegiea gigantea]|uniref:Uncharacterized protein n=1 Tax=Carnegiea gigantea TaxID=171969 RepID=A0A9Q1JZI0_9CARY|nr:hypothetical protein Cgig2_033771 [Carnegiea gigantea]
MKGRAITRALMEQITSEEYLKSIQHEDVVGEDVSLDDIDMILDLEDQEVKTVGQNIFKSRVLINMNPVLSPRLMILKMTKREVFVDNLSTSELENSMVDDVEDNQRNNTLLDGEHIRDILAIMPTLAKNNEAYIKDASQIKNSTILRDKARASHASRSPPALKQNSLQGVNKFCTTQIDKKHISVTNRMENSIIGMPQPHNLVNQLDDQNTSMGENTNTSGCSKQLNITRRLNFDQREQLRC